MATELTLEEMELTFVFICKGQAATTKLFPRAAVKSTTKCHNSPLSSQDWFIIRGQSETIPCLSPKFLLMAAHLCLQHHMAICFF